MKTDLLILGGGITARRAAAAAAEKYSVILVCDGSGASPYIHGLNVPLAADDSEELFLADTLKSGQYQNDPTLAEALVKGAEAVKKEFSAHFDRSADGSYDLLKPLGSSVSRVAGIGGRTGAKILHDLGENKKFTELEGTRALSLIRDGKSVVGARVYDRKSRTHYPIYARAVLIAVGGFGGIFRFSTNTADIGGDGAAMAYAAGAELVDMEFIQYEPTAAIAPPPLIGKSIITTMLFEGAVIRDGNGERFMDEQVGKDKLSEGIARQMMRGPKSPAGGVFYDMTAVDEEMLLGKYKDYYLRYKNHGIDVRTTPVEIAPAAHTTMGGIRIDASCRTNVHGLFAAGEAAGGVHGANRLGGNAGLEVLVFGDIAGRSICDFLDCDDRSVADLPDTPAEKFADEDFDATALTEILYSITENALGAIKSGDTMTAALAQTEAIIRETEGKEHSAAAMHLHNAALTVKFVLTAALMREESVGGHIRADFPHAPCGDRYCIILKNEDGQTVAEKQTIRA